MINYDNVVNLMTTGNMTDYILNDDKAKQQLLSNALRTSIEAMKQTKSTTKFAMCTGTYKEVIFPLLDKWSSQDLTAGGVRLNSAQKLDVQLL